MMIVTIDLKLNSRLSSWMVTLSSSYLIRTTMLFIKVTASNRRRFSLLGWQVDKSWLMFSGTDIFEHILAEQADC